MFRCLCLGCWKDYGVVGGKRLPDAWKLVLISASAMSFCDMSTYVFYIAMMQTSYGCDFDRLNAKIMGIWAVVQLPWMFISAHLVDGFPERTHTNIVIYGVAGLAVLWTSYFLTSVTACICTFVVFQLLSQMINATSTKLVKQRLEVFYGTIDFVEQDAEYTRISPWSDVVDSTLEMTTLLLMWWLLKQDTLGSNVSRTGAYIIETLFLYGILTLPLTFKRRELLTSSPSMTDLDFSVAAGKSVGFSPSKFLNGVQGVWGRGLGSIKALVRCRVAMHMLLRNLFLGLVMVLVGFPVTFNQARGGQSTSVPCGGAMVEVFLVGLWTEVMYVLGALLYLVTISGVHPMKYYSCIYPFCGVVMLGCSASILYTRESVGLNNILIAIVASMSYYYNEFDLCCGLAAIPQEHNAFFFAAWSIVAMVPYFIYYVLDAFDKVNDQQFLITVVIVSITVTIAHSFLVACHASEDLQRMGGEGGGAGDEEQPLLGRRSGERSPTRQLSNTG